jgi:hypothetical protein
MSDRVSLTSKTRTAGWRSAGVPRSGGIPSAGFIISLQRVRGVAGEPALICMSRCPGHGGAHARQALVGGLIVLVTLISPWNVGWIGHQSAVSDLAHWACRGSTVSLSGRLTCSIVCGLPRARAVLSGMVCLRRLARAYRLDTSSEDVGEATLARPARSGLASAPPGPGHQARIPNGIL